MAVLERVATLIRANLNDLIDRAEDPEKMIKQVILVMENQLLQVKTQVAISMADHHLLQKKQAEQADRAAEWMRKAELAVDKQQDDLARGRVTDGEKRRVLAEDVEERLCERQRGEGGEMGPGARDRPCAPLFTALLPCRHHRVTYFGLGRQIRTAKEIHHK